VPPPTLADRMVRSMPYALLGLIVAWTAARASAPLRDPDSWFHLTLGEHFLDGRTLTAPEHWSTFATSDWVPTQPLPEVVVALLQRWLGLPALVWLFAATVVVLIGVVFLVARQHAGPLPAVVATMLFVAAGQNAFTPRPQMLSYLLVAVVVATWLRTEQDLRPRWWLVPLAWLWSLCHGFWFIGVAYGYLFLVALLVTRRADRGQLARLAAVPVLSTLVVLLNPVGPRVFVAPFVVGERGQYIIEWQRTDLLSGPGLVALLMVLVTALVWVFRPTSASVFRVLLLVSALFWAWYAVRTVTLAGIVVAPLLAAALDSLVPKRPVDGARERRGLAVAAAALLAVIAVVVPFRADEPGGVPTAMDPALDAMPAGTTVLNEYTLGGWLSWRHPQLNRYIDGLADAYPAQHLADDSDLVQLKPGWERILTDARAAYALLADDSRLAAALEDAGWMRRQTDDGWVLLARP
jgi:hypothetical protein